MEAARRHIPMQALIEQIWESYQKALSGDESPKASKHENTGQALSSHYQLSTSGVVPSPPVRHITNQEDMVTLVLSRDEAAWVLGLLEAARGQVAPGVAGLIQGQVRVLLEWVRGLADERAGDTVPPSGTTPDLQDGVAGDQPGDTEVGRATKRIADRLRRVREGMAPARDRGEEPGEKKA